MRSSISLLSLLAVGCASSWRIYTRAEPNTTFRYQTFAITSASDAPEGYRRARIAAELTPIVTQTATAVLEEKGYRQGTADACDLLVSVGVGDRKPHGEESQQTDSTGSQVAMNDPDGPFNYTERALVIDAFEAKTHRRVWHGTARELMTSNSMPPKQLQTAIQALLEKLPGPKTMSPTAAAPSADNPPAR